MPLGRYVGILENLDGLSQSSYDKNYLHLQKITWCLMNYVILMKKRNTLNQPHPLASQLTSKSTWQILADQQIFFLLIELSRKYFLFSFSRQANLIPLWFNYAYCLVLKPIVRSDETLSFNLIQSQSRLRSSLKSLHINFCSQRKVTCFLTA